jgi:hypothetical protein
MKNLQLSSKLHNISELKNILDNENSTNDTLVDLYQKFSVKRINTFFDGLKTKGIASTSILFSLILTRLLNITVRALIFSGNIAKNETGKDTFYRMKNDSKIDWRKLFYYFIYRYLYLVKKHTKEQNKNIKCLIVDDSLLEKTGKKIEFIGRVFDHITKRNKLGFRMLTLGFWDSKSFNPLDFSFHREKGRNEKRPYGLKKSELEERYTKKRDKKSAGHKRVEELDKSKIKVAIEMIKRAVKHNIIADYVLFDSWFMCEEFIKDIRKMRNGIIHVLGMCKMDKRKYLNNNKELTAKELLRKYKKNIKRCRKIKSHYLKLVVDYKGIKVQLFFTRQNNRKDWKLLLTTNLELTYIETIEIYQIRWSIEVFFKESKQYLQLGKSQSNDFDAQIADTTISNIVYLILNFRKRFTDYETLGELFRYEKKTLIELNLWEKLWGLFLEMMLFLVEIFEIDIDEFMKKIVTEQSGQEKVIFVLEKLKEEQMSKNVA